MKSNSTLETRKSYVLFLAITLFIATAATAQAPRFRFQSPSLVSGSSRQTGAVYRFPNVVTNTDALVTIVGMTSGIRLENIDRTVDGYSEAFQPEYRISAGLAGLSAYIDFNIRFVVHNTSTTSSVPLIEASALDIDGSTSGLNTLMEFNTVDMGGGVATFSTMSSHIIVSQLGTAFTGRNITGFLYGALVDTAAYQVMFTVQNANVSSFNYRVGANSLLTSNSTRYASLYFRNFTYPGGSVLSVPNLVSFTGVSNDGQTKLQWTLTDNNDARRIVVEKAYTPNSFQQHTAFSVNTDGNAQKSFSYSDAGKSSTSVYYRLKITGADGSIEYSNVLHFRNTQGEKEAFMVYPSQVSSTVTAQLQSPNSQKASFEVIDFTGKVVFRQPVSLQQGQNNIRISNLDGIPAGMYISTLKTSEKTYSCKINKL